MALQWPASEPRSAPPPAPAGLGGLDVAGINAYVARRLRQTVPARHMGTGRIQVLTTPTHIVHPTEARLALALSFEGAVSNVWVGDSKDTAANSGAGSMTTLVQGVSGFWLPAAGTSGGFIWVCSRQDDFRGDVWMTASTAAVWMTWMELLP